MADSTVRGGDSSVRLEPAADASGSDIVTRAIGDGGGTWLFPNKRSDAPDGSIKARHSGGDNLVFCDAHVEYAKTEKWVEETDPARKRWNNDNDPHDETW